ncbi:hypothetical protein NPIL_384101 [Nephila pilipes]|uniref:Uncharacterized protein n=1 Tax=Nephila pilipes TaxID=299642 RepID=A0A8X6NTA3_NEPPI|nr:hypothetical protein NPIL_384101 [Nephila pilipes]
MDFWKIMRSGIDREVVSTTTEPTHQEKTPDTSVVKEGRNNIYDEQIEKLMEVTDLRSQEHVLDTVRFSDTHDQKSEGLRSGGLGGHIMRNARAEKCFRNIVASDIQREVEHHLQ